MTKQLLDHLVKEARRTAPLGALRHGTVIDHINPGAAIRLLYLLRLDANQRPVTAGFNLASRRMGIKDIVKVEGWTITRETAAQVIVFAPGATINVIEEYRVKEKFIPQASESLIGIIRCPNSQCITNHERAQSIFLVEGSGLRCHHCERVFASDKIPLIRYEDALP